MKVDCQLTATPVSTAVRTAAPGSGQQSKLSEPSKKRAGQGERQGKNHDRNATHRMLLSSSSRFWLWSSHWFPRSVLALLIMMAPTKWPPTLYFTHLCSSLDVTCRGCVRFLRQDIEAEANSAQRKRTVKRFVFAQGTAPRCFHSNCRPDTLHSKDNKRCQTSLSPATCLSNQSELEMGLRRCRPARNLLQLSD